MTDKEIIIDGLGCNNCPDKERCNEQKEQKNNIINLMLDDIKNTAIAYHCDLSDKINILKQNLPQITRCDVVLEKQLQREKIAYKNLLELHNSHNAEYNQQLDELVEQLQNKTQEYEELKDKQTKIKKYLGISSKTILERLEELQEFRDKDKEYDC